ncbi:MAG TPA: sigma-70 family RNA polymerase sigma factor, partial [Urbifossiella sp.]|nr:sigma-70 family RNA polymerase sigma factor [Urbifossiella sp.]
MISTTPGGARFGRITARFGPAADPDGQLLARFIAGRDEEAFAALVRRHGPLVLAVCRRVTADADLADDAFQATFLVLARKADAVRPREAVRGWLYGVAVRTALRARTMAGRRAKREVLVADVPDRPRPPAPDRDPDAVAALDEEVARLPESFRLAVVLCEIDGLSRAQAATRLGVAEGTLSSRLARARRFLAARLRARGLSAPAAGLAAALGPAAGTVSAGRVAFTARVAAGAELPSAAASALSREVLTVMLLGKLKYVPALLAGLVLAAAFGSSPAAPASPAPRPAVRAAAPAAPVPQPAPRDPVLMLWGEGYPILLSPDGTVTGRPAPADWVGDKWGGELTLGRLSPDGTR